MSQSEWENLASLLSLCVALIAAAVFAFGLNDPLTAVERWFAAVARRRWTCAIALPMLSLAVNGLITLHDGVPIPYYHDEFSYLLAADTFAHGRVTNPTPPFPDHFETPHQLMRPTYMSKYPPGQGLALAAGTVLTGRPVVGAWLATAVAVGCIYWMLYAFVSPPWALVGGVVAAIHPQLLDWSQCYWGGSVAVVGGALLLGGWGRLMIGPDNKASVAVGLGLAVLANSRPFEGLLMAIPLTASLVVRRSIRPLVPAGVVLLTVAVAMGYDNHRVTGHWWRLPFVEYSAQYDVYPKLWVMPKSRPPVFHNRAMQYIHGEFEKGLYDRLHTLGGFIEISGYRSQEWFDTTCKLVVLILPLVAATFVKRDRRLKWVWNTTGLFVVGLWAENFVLPHYQAPILPAVLLLIVIGWRHLAAVTYRARPIGRVVARATAVGFLAGAGFCAAQPVGREPLLTEQKALLAVTPPLARGRHIVFVAYAPLHSPHVEFVHNGADFDASPVLWARSFGPVADVQVARRFPDRKPWLLQETGKLTLMPYPGQ